MLDSCPLQATVDPALRHIKPEDEEFFVRHCAQTKLSKVSRLKAVEYLQRGVFQHHSQNLGNGPVAEFKECMGQFHLYKTDTCW